MIILLKFQVTSKWKSRQYNNFNCKVQTEFVAITSMCYTVNNTDKDNNCGFNQSAGNIKSRFLHLSQALSKINHYKINMLSSSLVIIKQIRSKSLQNRLQ
ncbi:unnamed protein product [Paramecium octaurelia]|uniref:Uncharacterized protein n=1 Tax=Paramecium octaurelia TaxID=43137 RepID=A0A8S1V874_PAROT|nr:unnamed protein product [Paramecium octaurelia]